MNVIELPELDRPAADPRGIFAALARHDVDYLLLGGLAVIAHGHPRTTQDVDIMPAPDQANMGRLAAALAELGAQAVGARGERLALDLSHPESLALGNYFLVTAHGGLDLVNGTRPGLKRYRRLASTSIERTVAGSAVRIVSKDDLLAMKREAGRPKDLRDIAALTAVERDRPQES